MLKTNHKFNRHHKILIVTCFSLYSDKYLHLATHKKFENDHKVLIVAYFFLHNDIYSHPQEIRHWSLYTYSEVFSYTVTNVYI